MLFLNLLLAGCQAVNDLQPAGDELPASVVQLIKDRFPVYDEIKISPLEKNRVWNARLKVDSSRYDLIVSRYKILSLFKAMDTTVPTTIQGNTDASVLAGGVYSDYMNLLEPQELVYDKKYQAYYNWNGTAYYADWNNLISMSGYVNFYPDVVAKYYTKDTSDLPEAVQKIINTKIAYSRETPPGMTPRPLEFWQAWVYVYKNQKKAYEIKLSLSELHIGQDNQVLFWDYKQGFDSTFTVLTRKEQLPSPIAEYLNNDPLAQQFPKFLVLKFVDNDRVMYNPRISNNRTSYSVFLDDSATVLRQVFYLYL